MDRFIDLHIHSTFSDGVLTPEQLVKRITKTALAAFAITDHDTIDGYRAVKELLPETGPELITGVELSVMHGEDDLHVLAYLFDPDNDLLNKTLEIFQKKRESRAQRILEKLADLNLKMPYEEVLKSAGGSSVGRPHIADTLFRLGLTNSYLEAFHKYIGKGKPAYVAKENLGPQEALSMVHQAGGLAVLAHPMVDRTVKHLDDLAKWGLDGVEVYHYSCARKDRQMLKRAATRLGLIMTGGSDFHGRDNRRDIIDRSRVPLEYLDIMKERRETMRGKN